MKESYVREDIRRSTQAYDLYYWASSIAQRARAKDIYRDKEGRKTLRFEWRGKSYFLKLHSGVGWKEIFKNLLQLRLPVLGASNEYRAVHVLHNIGVDTLQIVAYLSSGNNPAKLKSLLITEELSGTVTLEDYCRDWPQQPPTVATRRRLIEKLARTSRAMHGSGINHRDYYLCHFHLDEASLAEDNLRCYLIDLHRAQIRKTTPRRWRVKDIAGLYFSAMDIGLGRRDLIRFMRLYEPASWRQNQLFWRAVEQRAHALYEREHSRPSPMPRFVT